MNITCAKCGEPWESYHLQFDAIDETSLPESEREDFKESDGTLNERTQSALEELGWQFAGRHVFNITACPCCKETPSILRDSLKRIAERQALTILENDPDALAATLNGR